MTAHARGHERFLWTPEALDEMRRLWAAKVSVREIGRRLGCGHNAVVGMRRRLDLPERGAVTRQGQGFMAGRLHEVKALADEGLRAQAISDRMGVSRSSVQWALGKLRRLGDDIPPMPSPPPPANLGAGALDGRMDEVRALALRGHRATGIAERLSVTVSVAQKAIDKLRRQGVHLPKLAPATRRRSGVDRVAAARAAAKPKPVPAAKAARPVVVAPPRPVQEAPALALAPRRGEPCRWPSKADGRIVFACTEGAVPGACSPYCAEHLARAWEPLPRRRAA